jgi:hypothetical protein
MKKHLVEKIGFCITLGDHVSLRYIFFLPDFNSITAALVHGDLRSEREWEKDKGRVCFVFVIALRPQTPKHIRGGRVVTLYWTTANQLSRDSITLNHQNNLVC